MNLWPVFANLTGLSSQVPAQPHLYVRFQIGGDFGELGKRGLEGFDNFSRKQITDNSLHSLRLIEPEDAAKKCKK
jgi:hypothetical protein